MATAKPNLAVLADVTHTVWTRTIHLTAPGDVYFDAEKQAEIARICEETFRQAVRRIKQQCPNTSIRWY